jgi:hypothetical protein
LKDQVYRDEIGKPYASRELVEYRENKRCARIGKVSTSYFLRQDSYFTFWDTPDEIKGKPNYYLSDDDRLYWWDGSDEVEMSADTEQWLKELAKRHKEIVKNLTDEELQRVDFFEYFLKTILEINDFYKRIFPFQKMFYEFLQNGKNKSYFAAVMLFKELADSDEYKTDGAIIKYVKRNWDMTSKNVTHNPARLKLKRYLSVMANGKLRNIYFGF